MTTAQIQLAPLPNEAARDAEKAYDHQADQELVPGKYNEVVRDSDAKGYLDPTIVISDDENKRLRWMINKR